MRSLLDLLPGHRLRIPECNVLIGQDAIWDRWALSVLPGTIVEINSLQDSDVHPGLFRLHAESLIHIVDEKVMRKVGVWDAQSSLDPSTPAVYSLVEKAFKHEGVAVQKDHVKSVHWKLFEGTGGIWDVHTAFVEACQWAKLPPNPKPSLPWFDPGGFFRLRQVQRELLGYQAWQSGDEEKMKHLGVRADKMAKLSLNPQMVQETLRTLEEWESGVLEEESARVVVKTIWSKMRT